MALLAVGIVERLCCTIQIGEARMLRPIIRKLSKIMAHLLYEPQVQL